MQIMQITFNPSGKTIAAQARESLLAVAARAGIPIDASCGGTGRCGKCKVTLLKGNPGPITDIETALLSEAEIANGCRLACQIFVCDDLSVWVPKNHTDSPCEKKMLPLPSGFIPDHRAGGFFGVAFDIGTTTVVGMLWDMKTGLLTDSQARTNYQRVYGADVISRIHFCTEASGNLILMQQTMITCLNDILAALCERNGISGGLIRDVAIVGNTAMSHLVAGVDPSSLARTPFTPVFTDEQTLLAGDLQLQVHPEARTLVLPNIAGHLGSDIVGMLLAVGMDAKKGSHIAIDIGTNGEVVAIKEGRMVACSTAAGPAFEGASIRQGMRAAAGAIEGVTITKDAVAIQTIEDEPPIGLCGSGLMDAVAQLLESGIVDETGYMLTPAEATDQGLSPSLIKRITPGEAGCSFLLAYGRDGEDILLTQRDIREVQLAKGAILAGILTLMKTLSMQLSDIDSIMLAGAFGNYIKKESALRIGLLPQVPTEKLISVGNAAGAGASMALLSVRERTHAKELARRIEHIELSVNTYFQDYYIDAMSFDVAQDFII